jgi:signal transduction histidine kinase
VIRRLLFSYLTVTALALALLAIPLGITNAHRERERLLFDIERDADSMASVVQGSLTDKAMRRSDITEYAARTGGHVIVVNAQGRAVLDTDRPNAPGRDYSTRPEIRSALRGLRVDGSRFSSDLGTTLLYAAVPASVSGRVSGAVRITYPTATLDARVRQMWARLALLCGGVLVAVAAVGFALARTVTRPVRGLEHATERIAEGDLRARVDERNGPPELRHLAIAFNAMADRVERLIDVQEHFVADASHQLRTPLTALRLRLENLEAGASPADQPRLIAAGQEVARMARLVDGLLMLARGADDRDVRVPFDVVAIVRERVDIWSDVARDRGVTISFEHPAEARATGVPGAVDQIVDNLVDNALAVSGEGASIGVRVTVARSSVEIHVLDDGPGLDAADREQAFGRFWRGAASAPGGSGLGLSIVQQLAASCGGRARLDARPDGGIDAVVVIPAATGAVAPVGG